MSAILKLITLIFISIVTSWQNREALRGQGATQEQNKQLKANAELDKKISDRLNDNTSDGVSSIRNKLRKRKKG